MLIDLDRVMPGKLGKGKRSAGIFKLMGKLMPPNHGIGSGRLIPRSDGNRIGISIGSGAARNDGIGIGIGKSMGSETAWKLGTGNGKEIEASDAQTAAKTTNRRHCKEIYFSFVE